jgi:hypothetical protein
VGAKSTRTHLLDRLASASTASGGEAQVPFGATQAAGAAQRISGARIPDLDRNVNGVYAVQWRTDLNLAGRPVEHAEGCADLSR